MWNIHICTLSGPCSATREAKSDAHEGSGVSRVPLRASVRIDTLRSGLFRRASFNIEMSSNSVFPMYKVEIYIRFLAFRILS